MALNSEIKKLELPEKFRPIEKDLKQMHKIKEINYSEQTKIEL